MLGWTRLLSLQECCISGFHHEVDENCALLGYYAISSGNSLQTFGAIFRPQFQWSRIQERRFQDGSNRLSWNVSKEVPLFAV